MILRHHKSLTLERWKEFTPAQRILMIATEFMRAERGIAINNYEEVRDCYERALELLVLTIEAAKGNFLGELLRFKEILASAYFKKEFNCKDNQRLYQVLISLNKDAFNLITKQ